MEKECQSDGSRQALSSFHRVFDRKKEGVDIAGNELPEVSRKYVVPSNSCTAHQANQIVVRDEKGHRCVVHAEWAHKNESFEAARRDKQVARAVLTTLRGW